MHHKTVLIADDQRHMLVLLQACVTPIGCQVLTARSGEEALTRAASTQIDLLLIDFEMPGLTGIETATRLKSTPCYADLPIIMITGRGQNRIRADALQAGVAAVILKPFSPTELQELVRQVLNDTKPVTASSQPQPGVWN
jgi:two-component system cell cycle response regulator